MNSSTESLDRHEHLLHQLDTVQKGLLSVSENAEEDFLKLGQQLQSGYTSVSELANRALGATKITGIDSEDNDLTKARHSVGKALENLKTRQKLVESKLPEVKKVVVYLDELNSKRDEIEMIAKYLRAVALNIFIETARSEISNKNFSIIAEEIKELSESIIVMAKSIRDDSENAKNRFMDMYSNIATGIKTMNAVTTGAEDSVVNSIQSIKKLINMSHQSVKQAETMSREISKQVGNIVVGVQFHDDMRQRLEHIVTALNNVEPLCDELNTTNVEPNTDKLAAAHSVLTVQKAQIKFIINELDDIYNQNRDSFEKIITEIAQLVQILSHDSSHNLGDDDIFTRLSLALSDFQKLENQAADLVSKLGDTYQQASVTTEALSSQAKQIHEISRDSHIKALNAIIATQNMGLEGRTLLTLAGEMKTLSHQAENFVTDVGKIITSIISAIENVDIGDTITSETEGSDQNQFCANDVAKQISSLCVQMQNESQFIYRQSEELSTSLAEAKSNLDFFPVIGSELNNQMASLDKAIEILSPWAATIENNALPDNLINETYTMEKERKIHEQALELFSETPDAGADEAAGNETMISDDIATENDDDDQEFDDNIELF